MSNNKSGNEFWDETRNRMTDYENESTVCAAARTFKSAGKGTLNKKLLQSMKSAIKDEILSASGMPAVQENHAFNESEPLHFHSHDEGCCPQKEKEEEMNDDDIDSLLQRRLVEMKKQALKRREFLALGHDEYTEVNETEFLGVVTASKRCVVHFYLPEFQACKILDMHLRRLCKGMIGCRFVKVNATKCQFFISKLNVKVLPTLIAFTDGVAKKRMTGFDELGGSNEFPTSRMTELLVRWGLAVDSVESDYMNLRDD